MSDRSRDHEITTDHAMGLQDSEMMQTCDDNAKIDSSTPYQQANVMLPQTFQIIANDTDEPANTTFTANDSPECSNENVDFAYMLNLESDNNSEVAALIETLSHDLHKNSCDYLLSD